MINSSLIKGKTIKEVQVLPSLLDIESKLSETVEYFFTSKPAYGIPFRGFLLEGSVGTGKTELVKQIARKLDSRYRNVSLLFVDGSMIASKGWGEAEQKLQTIFSKAEEEKSIKIILLLDDIESLFMARGASLSKEWHFSINSVLFHQLDNIDPTKIIVFATTNRLDLVDEAIQSRLYTVSFPNPSLKQLMIFFENKMKDALNESDYQSIKAKVEDDLKEILNNNEKISIRDIEKSIIYNCIESGIWRV